jgi:hypothetical protein
MLCVWTTMAWAGGHAVVEPTISLPKTCFEPGEAIKLMFSLRNVSDRALTISTRWSHPRSRTIRLTGPDGRRILPSIIAVIGLPPRDAFVTLPPMGAYNSALLLEQDEWDHRATGRYVLQVIYENRQCDFFDPVTGQRRGTLACWVGGVESNAVEFAVSSGCAK